LTSEYYLGLKKKLKIQNSKNSKTTMASSKGTGTASDPYELSSSEGSSDETIVISSSGGSSDESGESDDNIPIMVNYRKRKADAMDEGADTEPEPEQPVQCDALRDALENIKSMPAGPAVPSRLSQVKMSPAERARMLKIVYQRVCDKVFKGERNPSVPVTAEQVRAACDIINEVIFNGLLDRTPYIVGVIDPGTESKAGDCRPAHWAVKRGKKVFLPARIRFNAGKLAAIVVVNGECPRLCNGLVCRDKASIMLSVLMHEIVHLLIHASVPRELREATGPGSRKWAPHGTMFMAIVLALYGHTDFKVALDTVVTSKSLKKSMVYPGLSVMLKVKGSSVATRGRVTEVNPKRAKVTMDTGAKFRVPYALLQRADPLN